MVGAWLGCTSCVRWGDAGMEDVWDLLAGVYELRDGGIYVHPVTERCVLVTCAAGHPTELHVGEPEEHEAAIAASQMRMVDDVAFLLETLCEDGFVVQVTRLVAHAFVSLGAAPAFVMLAAKAMPDAMLVAAEKRTVSLAWGACEDAGGACHDGLPCRRCGARDTTGVLSASS